MAARTNKSIEKLAREVRDDDAFVEHVNNIARRYRREYGLAESDRRRDLARALRQFQKHADALSEFLNAGLKRTGRSPESEALNRIGEEMHGSTAAAPTFTRPVLDWLEASSAAAERVLGATRERNRASRAQLIAAEALRATFEFHGLRFSAGTSARPADAARLFMAIARAGGDTDVAFEQVRAAITQVKQPTPKSAAT